jgi:hypothetical protein
MVYCKCFALPFPAVLKPEYTKNGVGKEGHNHLLEIRLLKTGFLSRFQPNP